MLYKSLLLLYYLKAYYLHITQKRIAFTLYKSILLVYYIKA